MKKTLLILAAAAGMLLLGGSSAKADDATTQELELKVSEGTFDNPSGGYHKTWTRSSSPVITITAGNNENDMCTDSSGNSDYSEGFELHEGSSYSQEDYIVSVEYGYLITGMSFKVVTAATGNQIPTVTLGDQEVTASSSPADMSISGLEASSVYINLSSTSNNGYATLYDWTITLQEVAETIDILEEIEGKMVTAIGDATTTIDTSKWYLLKQDRSSNNTHDFPTPAYDDGEGNTVQRAQEDYEVEVGSQTKHVAKFLLRFSVDSNTSTSSSVYNLQWGTGRYWTSTLTTTSDANNIGSFNIYAIGNSTEYIALNLYDMQSRVDNNGPGNIIGFWESGQVMATGGNNAWTIHEVTLTDVGEYDDAPDLSNLKVEEIGSAATELPADPTQWYLIKQTRGGETPAYDNGVDNDIMRASSNDVVNVGDQAKAIAKYLVRFLPAPFESSDDTDKSVYHLEWGTGNFWGVCDAGSSIKTTYTDIGAYNMYIYPGNVSAFALNGYDMGYIVNNNGAGSNVVGYESGKVTSAAHNGDNNKWYIYPVTLGEMTEEDEEAVAQAECNEKLLEAIKLAYDAYEANCGYVTEEKEVTTNNPTADGLITDASQLSSPYTETTEGQDVASLIDGDPTTYWHSNWSDGAVAADKHYLQVWLPDDFVVSGGPVTVRIQRRKGAASDQITKMAVKCVYFADDATDETRKAANSGTEFEIKTLSFPYDANYDDFGDESVGEVLYENFTCPAGVKWLRFHEEETEHNSSMSGSASGRGYWHLAEFQLYATSLTDDCGNTTLKKTGNKDATLLSAIQTAAGLYGNCTEENIATLEAAISTYLNENISWTLGADYGTLILPFNDNVDVNGLTVYPCTDVEEDVVQLGEAVNAIAPKTPYIVSGTANSTPITFSGEASFKTSLYSDAQDLLTGTLTGTTAPTNSYVLQDHDGTLAFYLVDSSEEITVGAYHCYLTLPDAGGNAKAVVYFPSSGVATAIEAVDGITTDNEAIYDLSGRKVTNPRSGIYIKGGKKVIIK